MYSHVSSSVRASNNSWSRTNNHNHNHGKDSNDLDVLTLAQDARRSAELEIRRLLGSRSDPQLDPDPRPVADHSYLSRRVRFSSSKQGSAVEPVATETGPPEAKQAVSHHSSALAAEEDSTKTASHHYRGKRAGGAGCESHWERASPPLSSYPRPLYVPRQHIPEYNPLPVYDPYCHDIPNIDTMDAAKAEIVRRTGDAMEMLEDENLRLIHVKNSAEADKERLHIESIRLRNLLVDQENVTRNNIREAQIESEQKDRMIMKLTKELQETQRALEDTRAKLEGEQVMHASTQSKLVEMGSDLDTERSCNAAHQTNIQELKQQVAALEEHVEIERQLKSKASKNVKRAIEIAVMMRASLKVAQQHVRDCSARDYFATKSQKVHDGFEAVLVELIDLTGSIDTSLTSKQVIARIEKLENAWAP